MKKISIKTDYITLGQFLKYANVISSGGMVKWFLEESEIKVNNVLENRRGKKLYQNDVIEIENHGVFQIESK